MILTINNDHFPINHLPDCQCNGHAVYSLRQKLTFQMFFMKEIKNALCGDHLHPSHSDLEAITKPFVRGHEIQYWSSLKKMLGQVCFVKISSVGAQKFLPVLSVLLDFTGEFDTKISM